MRIKQVIPAGIAQIIVLTGVNVQCALYPNKQILLALSEGINVNNASKVKVKVRRNKIQYPFLRIFMFLNLVSYHTNLVFLNPSFGLFNFLIDSLTLSLVSD